MPVPEHSLPLRVYYEDTDAGGVVYHANYLKYFERGRTEFLRTLGFEQDKLITQQDTIFVVRSLQIDYLQPARFNDELTIVTRVREMKKASLKFEQLIRRDSDMKILCEFSTLVACLRASSLRPQAIPPLIFRAMHDVKETNSAS